MGERRYVFCFRLRDLCAGADVVLQRLRRHTETKALAKSFRSALSRRCHEEFFAIERGDLLAGTRCIVSSPNAKRESSAIDMSSHDVAPITGCRDIEETRKGRKRRHVYSWNNRVLLRETLISNCRCRTEGRPKRPCQRQMKERIRRFCPLGSRDRHDDSLRRC